MFSTFGFHTKCLSIPILSEPRLICRVKEAQILATPHRHFTLERRQKYTLKPALSGSVHVASWPDVGTRPTTLYLTAFLGPEDTHHVPCASHVTQDFFVLCFALDPTLMLWSESAL